MANEVRSQRLMQFLGVASNPALAPFAKFDYIIREIAKSMELDPNKVTNDMRQAAIQAELLKQFRGDQSEQPQQTPAGVDPNDPTGAGGGTIGTGQAPIPGEQGFTGSIEVDKDKKQMLSKLKTLVNNSQLINNFNNYIDFVVEEQHKVMEQSQDMTTLYRAQGAIGILKRLKIIKG